VRELIGRLILSVHRVVLLFPDVGRLLLQQDLAGNGN